MSLTKSRQWHLEHLENSSSDISYNADFVASLEALGQDLGLALDFTLDFESNPYPSLNANAKPLTLSKKLSEFILNSAKMLDLNERETFKIYLNLKKLKIKNLLEQNVSQDQFNNFNQDSLFQDILFFYNQERLATLELITSLFRARQHSGHLYYEMARKITSSWLKTDSSNQGTSIKQKILDAYLKICLLNLPSKLENYSEKAAMWTRQNLLEQKALLGLQIMMYYYDYPTPEETVQVIKALVQLKIGAQQLNRPFFDRYGLEIYRHIEDLSSILFVEILNIQVALNRLISPPTIETLLDRPDSISAINGLIWDMMESFKINQDPNPIGVIAIAWSCYLQYLTILLSQTCPSNYSDLFSALSNTHPDVKSPQLLFQFGYQSASALEYMASLLSTSSFIQHDSNEIAYKSIIRELLNLLLVTQNVATLPDRSRLILVFSSLFQKNSILCNHFWTIDFGLESRASLLEAAQRSFPANFNDFINLTTCLIAGADSADYACQFLSMMPSFCDYTRGSDYEQSFEQVNGLNIWRWKGNNGRSLIHRSPNFRIAPEPGTEAYEVGPNVLMLKFQYSAWHLFLAYLDSFLHISDFEEHFDVHVGSIEITSSILKLFNCVLENADSSTRADFLAHLANVPGNSNVYGDAPEELLPGIVGEIMNRCSTSKVPMMDVISECLQTVKFLLPYYPEVVWKRLRGSNLFPRYAYSTGTAGYFQTSILPLECAAGKYPTTLSFLSLVKHLAIEAQKLNINSNLEKDLAPASILYSCVFFILRDIFSTYNSWRFAEIHEKFQITLLVLETLNIIMEDSTWYHHEQLLFSKNQEKDLTEIRLSSVTRLLLDTYVFNASNYQLSPLLDVIALGPTGPISFYSSNRKKEAILLEQSMIAGLRLLKRFLLALTHYNHASGLESALLDRTVSTSEGPVEFIQIIASLIDYQNNSDFAQLATENLALLCILSKKPGRPTTFFVGYFGAEAFSLVSKFIDLVRVEDQRAATSPAIQAAVYSFITSVVDSQPGLGAMFLSGYEPKSISSNPSALVSSEIPESSILYPLVGVLKKWKQIKKEHPAILLACLVLLDTLWQSAPAHQSTIKLLRGKKELWTCLLDIIKEKTEPAGQVSTKDCSNWCHFISTQAYALRLLSVEVYLQFRNPKTIVDESLNKSIITTLIEVLITREIPIGQEPLFHHPEYTEELQKQCYRLDSQQPFLLDGYRRITWNDSVDVDRKFGISFVYNIDLLERKLDSLNVSRVINQVKLVNMDWSFTDVQVVMLRASSFSTKLLTNSQWKQSISKDGVFHLMKTVLKNLQKHSQPHFIHIDYKNDLSILVVHLINYWLSFSCDSKDDLKNAEQILYLISMIQKSTMVAQFPFGPLGSFSKYPFHSELLSGMLLLIVKLSSLSVNIGGGDWQKKIDSLYHGVISSLCEGLFNLMGAAALSRDPFEESLLLSLLFELTRKDIGASVSVWLPLFEKYQICSLLINAFATWQPYSSKSNLCCLPEKVLELVLSLSAHAPCANILISNGLIASLCNNSFSNELMQGGTQGYDGVDIRQVHQIWCLLVSIISELSQFSSTDSHTFESVIGFVCLYQSQIVTALNSHIDGPLTIRSCWEVERVLGLFIRLADACKNRNMAILDKFRDQILSLTGLYVFMFKNPHELGHRLISISRSERDLDPPSFRSKIEAKLVVIVGYIVDFLRLYSKSVDIISDRNIENMTPLFTPSLSSFQESGATFGTLFDLLGHLLSNLRAKPNITLVYNCESLITLICAQLKLIAEISSATLHESMDLQQRQDAVIQIGELLNEFLSLIPEDDKIAPFLGLADSNNLVHLKGRLNQAKEYVDLVIAVVKRSISDMQLQYEFV